MVMRADVLAAAVDDAMAAQPGSPLIYFSPRGRRMDQALVQELRVAGGATLIRGRFEGVDERVLEARPITEVSLGDFVLSGGELAALALMDAVVRLLPGVMGEQASATDESFSAGLLEYPQYTRPVEWEGRAVPEVLLSGHHEKIAAWRRAMAEQITAERRPDLWESYRRTGKSGRGGEG
jgi:tRNA (guanine37-N1)-methyltransferase